MIRVSIPLRTTNGQNAITAERLRELLSYDPETGAFAWIASRGGRIQPGRPAGSFGKHGYMQIEVQRRKYLAHRLAWLYVTGVWPDDEIDHIDTNKANNAFGNLRASGRVANCQNHRVARRDNKSGYLGVSKKKNRWVSVIHIGGKQMHLGYFNSAEEASAAYVAAKRHVHQGNTL